MDSGKYRTIVDEGAKMIWKETLLIWWGLFLGFWLGYFVGIVG